MSTAATRHSVRYEEDRAAIATMLQELRAALAAVGDPAGAGAGCGATALPRARPAVRGGVRPARRVGLEPRPTSPARSRAGGASSGSAASKDRADPAVHGDRRGCACLDGSRPPSASSRSSGRSTSATRTRPTSRRLRDRTASLVGSHPVIVGSFVAHRDRRRSRSGGSTGRRCSRAASCPGSPTAPAASGPRLVSAFRTTGLGRLARGEPRARRARRTLLAHARQHGPRPEGGARRRAGARRHPHVPRRGPAHRPAGPVGARRRRLPALSGLMLWSFSAGSPRSARRPRDPARRLRAHRSGVRRPGDRPEGDGASWPVSG